MAREIPVGIDLGTTYSAAAWVDPSGRSQMVTNAEGDLLTPSIVWFDRAEVLVGKDARSATTVKPDEVAELVKRDMGQPVYSHPIRGELLPPEVIQACILRKLRNDVVAALGPELKAVITVPAYFDEPRRKATADAGELAGLSVLDIVNEPTAAALAFGETLGYLSPTEGPEEEITLLVYDLGGGTFDVTLLKLTPGHIQTIATDGDVQLGGHDWDGRLVDYVAESFLKSHQVDPRDDPAGKNRLYNAVIEAKHTLSARNRASVRIDYQNKASEIQITRRQFNEMTADLLERTAYTTRQLLAEAGLRWEAVSRVLLVGGSTRMPMVSEMLQQITGMVPDRTVHPDEAVARGAALYAGYLLAGEAEGGWQPSFQVTNVNAHSLGVEGIDQETLRKKNVVLIKRNTPLPAKFTERFITKSADQRSIVIQVLEGESSLPGECTAIGRTVVRDLPAGLPKGWPVEVTFEYGSNGRLSVRGVVPGTHQESRLELERAVGLSGEGIRRWKSPVSSTAGFEVFKSVISRQPVGAAPAAATTDGPRASAGDQATAAAAGPPAEAPAPAQTDPRPKPAAKLAIPPWVLNVIWHASAGLIGLGLGYLVLHLVRPKAFPLPW